MTEEHGAKAPEVDKALSRQRGISDPQPLHAAVAAYDVAPRLRGSTGAKAVRSGLTLWSALPLPEGMTYTVALGPTLYRKLGLPTPPLLREIPKFPHDRLDPDSSDGDILVQLCSDDPDAIRDVLRLLAKASAKMFAPRWREYGFLPPASKGETPRNLFGFKDGTENPTPAEADRWVWHPDGGTYLVYRRIHMDVSDFAALPRARREAAVGRDLVSGAPLGAFREHDPVNLFAKTPQGRYLIPADSHVRLAHSRLDGGARMLRRGYSYDNGPDDRGLLFLAYMHDAALFARVQERLDQSDAMSRFVEHRASAVGYVLPAPVFESLPGEQETSENRPTTL
ncbi:deferrochelatase/peroxidase EfeB [Streptomyces sp. V4I8]|uniref:Dyp-type peroxidase n=1 Tax=Streptomyces sp. V4I8 TaxID=3156469 RepID=UPI003514F02F